MLAKKLRGHLNLLCTFPGSHWMRANIQCGYRKTRDLRGGEMATVETRSEPYDETQTDRQTDKQTDRQTDRYLRLEYRLRYCNLAKKE